MLTRFIFTPITITVFTLTTFTFAGEKPDAVPLKKFSLDPKPKANAAATPAKDTKPPTPGAAEKKPGDVPWDKPEKWEGQGTFAPKPAGEPKPAKPDPAEKKADAPSEAEPQAARAILITKREITAQLEIFLDQQLFSPGMIDGLPGSTVTKALKRWQRAHGLPETGLVDANVPLESVYPVYTFHTVKKEEMKFVGELPGKTAEQATRKYLPYPAYADFLAERYHSNREFLGRLNPKMHLGSLKPGDQVRVPNVEPFKIEEMPDTGNFEEVPDLAGRRVVVNRKETQLDIFDGDKLIASIPIAPGSSEHPTPPGKWRILGIASMPTFRWDAGVLARGVRTDKYYMLPAGPRNPVGVAWIGLNKPGIGIHGTNNPYSIGTFASHGCMRTANWDIARVSRMLTAGVAIEIK